MKLNYFVIPLLAVLTSVGGSLVTDGNMTWYDTLVLPAWTPPGFVIGIVWTMLYALTAIAVLLVWNKMKRDRTFWYVLGLFVINAVINVSWSYVFFGLHLIATAIWVAALLDLTVIMLIGLLWHKQRTAAWLLVPYAAWVTFATFLNHTIFTLNI